METMASSCNLLSGFALPPVGSITDSSSSSSSSRSWVNKKRKNAFVRPQQYKSFGKHYTYNYNCNSCSRKPIAIITCGAVSEINERQFPDVVLKSDRPVLVEFVATWCGPCRLIAPIIEWAAQEYQEQITVVKIDHDANPGLIEEYKVYGLPALILFKNGKEVAESRREGAITKAKIKEYLDALLDSVSVS